MLNSGEFSHETENDAYSQVKRRKVIKPREINESSLTDGLCCVPENNPCTNSRAPSANSETEERIGLVDPKTADTWSLQGSHTAAEFCMNQPAETLELAREEATDLFSEEPGASPDGHLEIQVISGTAIAQISTEDVVLSSQKVTTLGTPLNKRTATSRALPGSLEDVQKELSSQCSAPATVPPEVIGLSCLENERKPLYPSSDVVFLNSLTPYGPPPTNQAVLSSHYSNCIIPANVHTGVMQLVSDAINSEATAPIAYQYPNRCQKTSPNGAPFASAVSSDNTSQTVPSEVDSSIAVAGEHEFAVRTHKSIAADLDAVTSSALCVVGQDRTVISSNFRIGQANHDELVLGTGTENSSNTHGEALVAYDVIAKPMESIQSPSKNPCGSEPGQVPVFSSQTIPDMIHGVTNDFSNAFDDQSTENMCQSSSSVYCVRSAGASETLSRSLAYASFIPSPNLWCNAPASTAGPGLGDMQFEASSATQQTRSFPTRRRTEKAESNRFSERNSVEPPTVPGVTVAACLTNNQADFIASTDILNVQSLGETDTAHNHVVYEGLTNATNATSNGCPLNIITDCDEKVLALCDSVVSRILEGKVGLPNGKSLDNEMAFAPETNDDHSGIAKNALPPELTDLSPNYRSICGTESEARNSSTRIQTQLPNDICDVESMISADNSRTRVLNERIGYVVSRYGSKSLLRCSENFESVITSHASTSSMQEPLTTLNLTGSDLALSSELILNTLTKSSPETSLPVKSVVPVAATEHLKQSTAVPGSDGLGGLVPVVTSSESLGKSLKYDARVKFESFCGPSGFIPNAVTGQHQETMEISLSGIDSGEVPCPCEQCGVSFLNSEALLYHVQNYHVDSSCDNHATPRKHRPFPCLTCGRSFLRTGDLNRHRNVVHGRVRKSICPICSAGFGHAGDMNRHVIRVHEKGEYHQCDECPSTFGSKAAFAAHKKIHAKRMQSAKPISCLHCTKSFASIEERDAHSIQVHVSNKYVCSVSNCFESFPTPRSLKAHILAKHETVIRCTLCKATFRKSEDLLAHNNRRHHSESVNRQ